MAFPNPAQLRYSLLYRPRPDALAVRRFVRPGGVTVYHEILVCPPPGHVMDRLMPMMDVLVANSSAVGSEMQARWPESA